MQIGLGISPTQPYGVAVPAFTPASISGLQLWLDASDASTLFTDSAGTTAATADGDPVGCWKDKSPNGWNMTQTDGTKKPILKPNQQNAKSGIIYDGVNDCLSNAIANSTLTSLFGTNDFNFYFAGSQTNSGYYRAIIMVGDGRIVFTLPTSGYLSTYCGADLSTTYNMTTGGRKIFGIRHINSTKRVKFDVNSVSYDLGPMGSNANLPQSMIRIGSNINETQPITGYNFEMLIYNSSITDANHANIMNYLKSKWSLT